MTELSGAFAIAAALGWASGIRLYAVVFVCGLLHKLGYVVLPGELHLLAHEVVLATSGVLLVGEFVADKLPWFDSLWDALHTFIRLPGGAALAFAALGEHGAAAQVAAALLGGTLAAGSHLGKSGSRLAINHSPEPFSNWAASFAEDGLVLGGLWLAWQYPWVFAALLLLFVLTMVWLLPKLWRLMRRSLRALAALLRGQSPWAHLRRPVESASR